MRRKPFFLPLPKPDTPTQTTDQANLQNEFFGKILFKSNLYHLVTGNVAILETIENKWFLNELFNYSQNTFDPNIIKALKKIASSERFDESVRQHASEIAEIIDDNNNGHESKNPALTYPLDEKVHNARKILAGIRYPQTSEVLRLLRDKSPEVKRLALWLIGKFRMTDLSQEVCECLAIHGTEEDAFSVLLTLGRDVVPDIKRFYLTSAGNTGISKAILRLFSKMCPEECMSFIVERLWSTSREVRETTLKSLINCGYIANDDEKERLRKMIYDMFRLLAWLHSARLCLILNENTRLCRELDKDYERWKEFLLNLLELTYGHSIPVSSENDRPIGSDENYDSIHDLAEIVFSSHGKELQNKNPDMASERKLLKRLQKFFPVMIPDCEDLLEDLINYDYNVISIWTKATAIRSIDEIRTENLGESIVALLFSPEEILHEEATRLIARTGKDLYNVSSDRIIEPVRSKLDKIFSGNFDQKELVYEKLKFLSGYFGPVQEDEMIYLAERLLFVGNITEDKASIPPESLIWVFNNGDNNPSVLVNHAIGNQFSKRINELKTSSGSYVLPFSVIEDFCLRYPENSHGIYRYIDNCDR